MLILENRATVILYNFLRSNIRSGKFLLPANVCPIVPTTFLKAGLSFDFIDIDDTHAMDQDLALKAICLGGVKGVLFVHAYGHQYDTSKFYCQIKEFDSSIVVIDDRCLCPPEFPSENQNNIDLTLYSTGYAKYVELLYGGFGIMNDSFSYKREFLAYDNSDYQTQMDCYKQYLSDNKRYYYHDSDWLDISGSNWTIEEYRKIVLEKKEIVDLHKRRLNAIYDAELPNDIKYGLKYCDWRFLVCIPNRALVLKALFDNGLFAGTNFPSVSYMFSGIHSPIAEVKSMCILNLFNDLRVDTEFVFKSCRIINSLI